MYWSTQSYVWICLEKLMYCKSATLVKLSFPGFLFQRKKRKHRTVRLNMWLEFSNCRHWWRFELCFKKSNITCHSMHSHTAASSQWSLPLLDLLLYIFLRLYWEMERRIIPETDSDIENLAKKNTQFERWLKRTNSKFQGWNWAIKDLR